MESLVGNCPYAGSPLYFSLSFQSKKELLSLSIKSLDFLVPPVGKLHQPVICFSAELFWLIIKVVSIIIASYVLSDGKDM